MDRNLEFFVLQQRELIRQRQSNYLRNVERRTRKNTAKRKAVRVAAPTTGGPKADQASPPVKGQSDIIDLSALLSDSDEAEECAETASVPAAVSAAAAAFATAAEHAATTPPPRTQHKRVRRKLPPRGHPLNPVVPATISTLWEEVEQLYDRRQVDPPLCPHHECPYCTGALMEQRYDLMQRLLTLEKLFGWVMGRLRGRVRVSV